MISLNEEAFRVAVKIENKSIHIICCHKFRVAERGDVSMDRLLAILLTILLLLFGGPAESLATMEWNVLQTLNIEKTPVDAAMSTNGKWIYVLTDSGEVLIYEPGGRLRDRITVGAAVDGIMAGPREDILLLTSRKDATVKIITLDFVQNINLEGSPFKGPADAPVVIVNFSDFQ